MKRELHNGDCIEVMERLPDASIDLILCDLPYGTTDCKWDIVIPFESLWKQYERVIKENGAIVLFGIEPFSSHLRLSNPKIYRYDWYWEKDRGANFLFANRMPLKTVETISVFYKKLPTYNPQKTARKKPHRRTINRKYTKKELGSQLLNCKPMVCHSSEQYEPDKALPRQILSFPRDRDRIHPTQKPVALLEYLIRTYSNKEEVVLDNCMGSGSTAIACYNMRRKFIGIERDPRIFSQAQKHIEQNTRQLLLNFG